MIFLRSECKLILIIAYTNIKSICEEETNNK